MLSLPARSIEPSSPALLEFSIAESDKLLGPHALTEHVASASALPLGVSKKEESMTIPHDLLNDLRSSATDLARIVEAVFRDGLPYVMIPSQAVRSWGAHRAYRGLGFGRRSEGEDAAECGDCARL